MYYEDLSVFRAFVRDAVSDVSYCSVVQSHIYAGPSSTRQTWADSSTASPY